MQCNETLGKAPSSCHPERSGIRGPIRQIQSNGSGGVKDLLLSLPTARTHPLTVSRHVTEKLDRSASILVTSAISETRSTSKLRDSVLLCFAMTQAELKKLRLVINESLRVQRGGAKPVPYIDVSNSLSDVLARQNHAIFGRRGCGKTLLLHHSSEQLPKEIRPVYLNCEDFKKHSFPNVLIEILDALFAELQRQLTGWFGKKKRSRELITSIRKDLESLRSKADSQSTEIREAEQRESEDSQKAAIKVGKVIAGAETSADLRQLSRVETERKYSQSESKIRELDMWLPRLKQQIREFFELSREVKAIFLQVDDFYHLTREDQPLVMDYLHRLCKDLPLYFKVATLKHASTLYADRLG